MLHTLHRVSACIIGSFVAFHVVNHLLALQGVEAHIAFMESFRRIYRSGFVETLLLGCVAFQIGSGILLIKKRWGRRRRFFERVQTLAGGYLAYFLLIHVGAVLYGRVWLRLDTNFYFAAAGMHIPPFHLYFLPYYFLAVVAIFAHVACAVHWLTRDKFDEQVRNYFGYAVMIAGFAVSGLIVSAFAGSFYPIDIPIEYRATYQQ